jgi:NhaP-type Na+/H+ or K+/H+ antiporter
MAFSLLVLGKQIEAGGRIFDIAALAVLTSIIVHGVTDTPGVEWIARRSEEDRSHELERRHPELARAPARQR